MPINPLFVITALKSVPGLFTTVVCTLTARFAVLPTVNTTKLLPLLLDASLSPEQILAVHEMLEAGPAAPAASLMTAAAAGTLTEVFLLAFHVQ